MIQQRNQEFDYIAWLRGELEESQHAAAMAARGPFVGVGDDTAVVPLGVTPTLVTVDMLLEGVHFDLATADPVRVGRKAMNVNLSDIAAMGGQPVAAVVAVALPEGAGNVAGGSSVGQGLFVGLRDAAAAFGVTVVGGDTNRSQNGLVISVTVFGVPTGPGPVTRSGAKPGDLLCVTGSLGYSLAGHHLDFVPRVLEAQALNAALELHAMIDLSDGLGSDLFHILSESKVGATVDADSLPIRSVPPNGDDGRAPLEHALDDGEDFELLFACPPASLEELRANPELADLARIVTPIGIVESQPGARLRTAHGVQDLSPGGYRHAW